MINSSTEVAPDLPPLNDEFTLDTTAIFRSLTLSALKDQQAHKCSTLPVNWLSNNYNIPTICQSSPIP